MRQRLRQPKQIPRLKRRSGADFTNKLVTSDWHLTDSAKDEYRWNIFNWILQQGKSNNCKSLYIVGDITERKDHHSGKLVNRLINGFTKLLIVFDKIIVLKGNHDYDKDEMAPFFGFLSSISNIEFINEPREIEGSLFLPHTRFRTKEWNNYDLDKYSYVYLHTTVRGAKFHDGYVGEEGLEVEDFADFKNIMFISGDVHIPQNMGSNFIYVGSPYPIKFGDDYTGRILIINDKRVRSIKHDSIKKHSWNITANYKFDSKIIQAGDHMKVTINLHQSEFQEYYKIRKDVTEFCKKNKLELFSIEMKPIKSTRIRLRKGIVKVDSMDSILKMFSEQQQLSREQVQVGKELLLA